MKYDVQFSQDKSGTKTKENPRCRTPSVAATLDGAVQPRPLTGDPKSQIDGTRARMLQLDWLKTDLMFCDWSTTNPVGC